MGFPQLRVSGLGWLGIRTDRFEETATFFRDVWGLEVVRDERDVIGFRFPDGVELEVWRPEDEFHDFFTTGPVVGFEVGDHDAARSRMEAANVQFLGRRRVEPLPGSRRSGVRDH